jgi:hypothetical protein
MSAFDPLRTLTTTSVGVRRIGLADVPGGGLPATD